MRCPAPSWAIAIDSQDGLADASVKNLVAHKKKGEYRTCRGQYEFAAKNNQKLAVLYVGPDKKGMYPNEDRRSREARCWQAESWHEENADCGNRMKCRVEVSPEGVVGIVRYSDNMRDFSEVKRSKSCRLTAGRVEEEIVSCTVEPPT